MSAISISPNCSWARVVVRIKFDRSFAEFRTLASYYLID
ncbi:MAG: hypothetical protein ACI8P9_002017 [Parasphingorhabdus sp.]|jgi:hypothetical protein